MRKMEEILPKTIVIAIFFNFYLRRIEYLEIARNLLPRAKYQNLTDITYRQKEDAAKRHPLLICYVKFILQMQQRGFHG
jgi:hypothetical protein